MNETTPAIELHQVDKWYGSAFQALKKVSFDVKQGEVFGLLGPNGAGKSTLISILGGLIQASSGQARIMGYDVASDYRMARRNIGIVPQEIAYDPFFTVKESLVLQLGYMGLKLKDHEDWIDYLIESMGLADKTHSRVKSLSGGMKRRVLIAQALVHKPPVVVLDEPTAGVDVGLRQSLWAFVRELNQEGHTIVLTTHYLEEAESLCDRIAILDYGQLTHLSTKQALIERVMSKRLVVTVAECVQVAQINTLVQALPDTTLVPPQSEEAITELCFELHAQGQTVVDVLNQIQAQGLTVQDIKTEQASLEDAFLNLTNTGVAS